MAGQANTNLQVRRNTSNQIISYTHADPLDEYVDVLKVAQRNIFDKGDFNRVIAENPTELLEPNPFFEHSILKIPHLNLGTFSRTFKWNGELIRIGNTPGASGYYYIEDGKYHRMQGNGILNFVSEKLRGPLSYRTNDDYDYATYVYDYGQAQYSIYNVHMYKRKTSGYKDSFTWGGFIHPIDVMPDGVHSRRIALKNELSDWHYGIIPVVLSSAVGGSTSTRAAWVLRKSVEERRMVTTIGGDIIIQFTTPDTIGSANTANTFLYVIDWWYKLTLTYKDDMDYPYEAVPNVVTINVKVSQQDVEVNGVKKTHKYTIPAEYNTNSLDTITISAGANSSADQNALPDATGTPFISI